MSTALTLTHENDGELSLYFREVSRFPLLTADEELALARRWHDEADVEAAHRLVTANLRFVVKIANEYRRYGFRMLDLIQEGNVGLMRAVHKFDPNKGFRLITYAVWWIRAHIHDFILRSWSLVRIGTTRLQRKLFNHLQSAQARIRALIAHHDEGDEDGAIAADLDASVDDVTEFRRRVQTPDVSLEEPLYDDGEAYLRERIVDESASQEDALAEAQARSALEARVQMALATLSPRDRIVAERRLLADDPVTLKELGEELGVSKERVRQLEERVKKQLRAALADVAEAA